MGGEATTIVTLKGPSQTIETRHYSKRSGLLVLSESVSQGALGKSSKTVTRFETYSEFDGVKWPTRRVETTSEGVLTTVAGFRVERRIDDLEFAVPSHVETIIAHQANSISMFGINLQTSATLYGDKATSLLNQPSYHIDVSDLGRVIFITKSFVRIGALSLPDLAALEALIDQATIEREGKAKGCGVLALSHTLYLRSESIRTIVGCVHPERPGLEEVVDKAFAAVHSALELEAAGIPKDRRLIAPMK